MDARHRNGLVWAFVGVLLFSFSLPLTKVAVGGFNPFFTATGRAVIAGVLAAVLLLAFRVPWPAREHLKPLLFTMLGAVFGWPILLALVLESVLWADPSSSAVWLTLFVTAAFGGIG